MTTAHSRHHASQVDPTTREYINARINEELAPIRRHRGTSRCIIVAERNG